MCALAGVRRTQCAAGAAGAARAAAAGRRRAGGTAGPSSAGGAGGRWATLLHLRGAPRGGALQSAVAETKSMEAVVLWRARLRHAIGLKLGFIFFPGNGLLCVC